MLHTLSLDHWQNFVLETEQQKESLDALEQGAILFLPKLSFQILPEEEKLFELSNLHYSSKNLSYSPHNKQIGGAKLDAQQELLLKNLLDRFMQSSSHLLRTLFPEYQSGLTIGRTSFRPKEIAGRKQSPRQDDTRLHVDAFPATPNQGKRILRVFCNINPEGKSRIWNVGEDFKVVLEKFAPHFKLPIPGLRQLYYQLGLTKTYRTLYDHYMLSLHDNMKLDQQYQNSVPKVECQFPSNTSWIVMTDKTSHAALSGQHCLEQTFYLPAENMSNPQLSPLAILQEHFKCDLLK